MVKVDVAIQFYAALSKAAKRETVEGTTLRVFRGKVVEEVWDSIGRSRSYYSKVSKALVECGAIQVIQKGNSRQDTVIALHGKPDPEAVSWAMGLTKPAGSSTVPPRRQRKGGDRSIEDRINDIEHRLDVLEGRDK